MARRFEGKYEIVAKLREGGMGAIYKVRHVLLNQVRVIKVMKPRLEGDADAERRFIQEAKLANRLSHPNLAAVLDFAEDSDKTFYIVMEYVEGVNLRDFVRRGGRPPLRTAVEIGLQTLAAIAYLHQEGVVHRDVSPDNIMLTRDRRGQLLVKLIDLGVAKQTDAAAETATGAFVGKLKFASPEQLDPKRFGGRLDGRSDVYSFGCVLYWLLTGFYPFEADSFSEYVTLHLFHPPRPYEETDPEGRVPPALREAAMRCLAKKREERWPSAPALAEVLRALVTELELGEMTPPGEAWLRPDEPAGPPRSGDSEAQSRFAKAFPAATPTPGEDPTVPLEGSTVADTVVPAAAMNRPGVAAAAPARGEAPPRPRRPLVATRLASAFLIGASAVALFLVKSRTAPPPVPPPFGRLVLTAEPWGRVTALEGVDGTHTPPAPAMACAPAVLRLPPGRYRVTLAADAFGTASRVIDVPPGETVNAHVRMPNFDLEQAIAAYAR